MNDQRFTWYEFFAGGGMARLGLGGRWQCIFANEWCPRKAAAYRAHFGDCDELKVSDVARLGLNDLPSRPDLVWASFPCQDLSLAGTGAGLDGERSGAFRPFWRLIEALIRDDRAPGLIVLENVVGALTSHGGADFATIIRAFARSEYHVGALVIEAVHFLPQSRPRLFVVGSHPSVPIHPTLIAPAPSEPWHTNALCRAQQLLPEIVKDYWRWWNLPIPSKCRPPLQSLIEDAPSGVAWHTEAQTKMLLSLMNPLHQKKVEDAKGVGGRQVGTIYKRTRPNSQGIMAQRAEARFDGISGCLRTPVGGSSRQTVIVVEKGHVRTRLLSPREAARLMGAPDNYRLSSNYNEAYHVFGDGVAVPVVSWLEKYLLHPLAANKRSEQAGYRSRRAAGSVTKKKRTRSAPCLLN